ncbi:MAG: response regulator transcription factor [Tepidiformaceae bacterium]
MPGSGGSSGAQFPEAPNRYLPVLRGVVRGRPNKHIAAEAGLSESTVGHYVSELFDLFACDNRTELALVAMNHPKVRDG